MSTSLSASKPPFNLKDGLLPKRPGSMNTCVVCSPTYCSSHSGQVLESYRSLHVGTPRPLAPEGIDLLGARFLPDMRLERWAGEKKIRVPASVLESDSGNGSRFRLLYDGSACS